jgi:nucleoside-diphosphate-sugar epimerase
VKVFVAGATGAIGRPLVSQLLVAGHEVSAMSRSGERAERLRDQGVDAYVGEALDPHRLSQVLGAAKPEVVVHQLTTFPTELSPSKVVRDLRQTSRLRTEGARLLLAAGRRHGLRRVVAQSIAYGYRPLSERRRATEDDPYYGRGQTLLDLFFRHILHLESAVTNAEGVEGVALRYGGWYGPRTHFGRGGAFYRLAMKRRLPAIDGATGAMNAVHVEDAAAAVLTALSGPTGTVNVVDDDPLRADEFVKAYCEGIGAPDPRVLPRWIARFTGFYGRHLLLHQVPVDNAKAKHELGWRPTYPTLPDGLAAIV